ncbi:MAG: 30S ribosomal protein S20, partial [Acidobacteriota bacterium]
GLSREDVTMANHKSALKASRQAVRRRLRNRQHRSTLRTEVKKIRGVIASGDGEAAARLLGPTLALLDHTSRIGVVHRNTSARTKSQLTRQVNRLTAGS